MVKLFIWDFHGVLEKGNEHSVVEVTNKVLEEYGADARLDMKLCLQLYGKKWSEFYRLLLPSADEKTILEMVDRGIAISYETDAFTKYTQPMDFAQDVLLAIQKAGHENLIISNTHPAALDKFLDAVKITSFISHTIGVDSHRKDLSGLNNKIPAIKEFLKERKYDKIISIGDRATDVEMGKSINATTYHFSTKGFEKADPDYQITDLREVLKEL